MILNRQAKTKFYLKNFPPKTLLLIFITVCGLLIKPSPVLAKAIISGISGNQINIDNNFKGSDVQIFGARNGNGALFIAVRGPEKDFLVNKKERFFGIWHNGKRVKFNEVLAFYREFSNQEEKRPNSEIFHDLQISENNLPFVASEELEPEILEEFKKNLILSLEKRNLYQPDIAKIDFFDEGLFRAVVNFPKNIPLGTYSIETYLISNGEISDFQTIPIYVHKIGFGAKISNFANQQPVLYGLFAVLFALSVGWLTNYIFNRFFNK